MLLEDPGLRGGEPSRSPAGRRLVLLGALLLAGSFAFASLIDLEHGRADNGDFTRLAGHWIAKPRGFAVNWPAATDPAWSRRFFGCWLRYWEMQPDPAAAPPVPADAGTTRYLWLAAFGLDRTFSSPEVFDLLWLGALVRAGCLALLLWFYGIAVNHLGGRCWWLALLAAAPLAASLADPRLSTYYNSFYREAGSALYALLAVCGLLAISGRRPWIGAALAAAGGALLARSASAHFFTALLMAAAVSTAVLLRRRAGTPAGRRPLATAAAGLGLAVAVAVLLAAAFGAERSTDRRLRKNAAFHTLFLGLLQVSDRPEAHLAYLGLPAEGRQLIGANAFRPDTSRFIEENWDRFGHRAAARLLLREPVLIARMLHRGAMTVNDASAVLAMTSDAACSGAPPRLGWWTALKGALLPRGYPLLALLAAAAMVGLAAALRGGRHVATAGLALAFAGLGALGEIAVAVFGDGFSELPRHLLLAGLFVDVALALLILLAALAVTGRGRAPNPVAGGAYVTSDTI